MRVRMRVFIGGFRDGVAWPPVGGEIDLPAHEAESMAAVGYVEVVGGAAGEGSVRSEVGGDSPAGSVGDPSPAVESPPARGRGKRA